VWKGSPPTSPTPPGLTASPLRRRKSCGGSSRQAAQRPAAAAHNRPASAAVFRSATAARHVFGAGHVARIAARTAAAVAAVQAEAPAAEARIAAAKVADSSVACGHGGLGAAGMAAPSPVTITEAAGVSASAAASASPVRRAGHRQQGRPPTTAPGASCTPAPAAARYAHRPLSCPSSGRRHAAGGAAGSAAGGRHHATVHMQIQPASGAITRPASASAGGGAALPARPLRRSRATVQRVHRQQWQKEMGIAARLSAHALAGK
jgi:hypothetical protein